ncbi:methyltransferase [Urbifossiella limnaea]|uniref:Multifunctional cyclase-dehydratase-3-O-methyl transferase TcmN n=1 Tax=Urbifossiella limnaea TaxID=2528023 RepID=A0A517XSR2_9BACT|nr:methyltransferase [Urbifossiella limnaea]QDU20541.1 Multifunctional cyclase-dehydratase-3-O-methyl transferase TcmN [Urbifossiella limnaea]
MPPPPNAVLFQLIAGKWIAQALSVVARFRVADHLAAGPKTATELAALTGTHTGHLYRVLRALASVGVLDESADMRFALTAVGEYLRGDVPGSMRAVATYCCDPWSWKPWGDLAETVRSGTPAFDRMFGQGVFDYLSQHPDEFATFNEGMTGFSAAESAAAVKAYDFRGYGTIADVGGGHGLLLTTILKADPDSRGVVFDLPGVVDGAAPTIAAAGLAGRCATHAGSFFDTAPAADLHVMKHIIHDWNDEKATQILRRCRAAVHPGGKLVLIEMVIPAAGGDPMGKLLDLEMMVLCDGKERTEAEYAALLAGAGYRLTRVVPTESPACVLEAEPV